MISNQEINSLNTCLPNHDLVEKVYDVFYEKTIERFVQEGMKRISPELLEVSSDVFLFIHKRRTIIMSTCSALTDCTEDCSFVIKAFGKVDQTSNNLALILKNPIQMSAFEPTVTYVLDGWNRKGEYLDLPSIQLQILEEITVPVLKQQLLGLGFQRISHFNASNEDIFIKFYDSDSLYCKVFMVLFHKDKPIKVLTSCYQSDDPWSDSFYGNVLNFNKRGENVFLTLQNQQIDYCVSFEWRNTEHRKSFKVSCTRFEYLPINQSLASSAVNHYGYS